MNDFQMYEEGRKEEESKQLDLACVSESLHELKSIELEPVYASSHCTYSVLEYKLETLYKNQQKILDAIKLVGNAR